MTTFEVDYLTTAPLKIQFKKDYNDFGFDDAYFQTLLSEMGVDADAIDARRFASEHFNLLYGYLQCAQREAMQVSIDAENKELTRIQEMARKLSGALDDLSDLGRAGIRLHDELASMDPTAFRVRDVTIADTLDDMPHKRFDGLTSILYDLRIGLERAKIAKPKMLSPPKWTGDADGYKKAQRAYQIRVFSRPKDERESDAFYRKRMKENAPPANSALTTFALVFKEFWEEFTDLPFTESRYEPAAKQNISRTVDAAKHCLDRFGANYPRSLITRKIREVREGQVVWAS